MYAPVLFAESDCTAVDAIGGCLFVAESARHVVEDALFPSTEVVEFDNLSIGRLVVISCELLL